MYRVLPNGDCDATCAMAGVGVPINGGSNRLALCAYRQYDDYVYGTWNRDSRECFFTYPSDVTKSWYVRAPGYYCACTSVSWTYSWGNDACAVGEMAASKIARYGRPGSYVARSHAICRVKNPNSPNGPWLMGSIDVNGRCVIPRVAWGPNGGDIMSVTGYGGAKYNVQALCARPGGAARVCIRPLTNGAGVLFKHCLIDLGGVSVGYYTAADWGINYENLPATAGLKCAYVQRASIHTMRKVLQAVFAEEQYKHTDYSLCTKNCCTFVNHILTNSGSLKVDRYFPYDVITGPCNGAFSQPALSAPDNTTILAP